MALVLVVSRPARDPSRAGERAPAFETFDLEARPVALGDYRGKVVLLNFWASWCVPCRREFPLLKEVHGGDVVVLGVVFQDSRRPAAAFMREQGATWPGLVDPRGQIARAYGVGTRPGIPVTVAVSPDGRLRARHVGEAGRDDLRRLVGAAAR